MKWKRHVRHKSSHISVTGVPEKETKKENMKEVTGENFPKLLEDINPHRFKQSVISQQDHCT